MSQEMRDYDNLLEVIKCSIHSALRSGDFTEAEVLTADLHTRIRTARNVSELVIVAPTPNKEAVTRMTA